MIEEPRKSRYRYGVFVFGPHDTLLMTKTEHHPIWPSGHASSQIDSGKLVSLQTPEYKLTQKKHEVNQINNAFKEAERKRKLAAGEEDHED
jgi:hypothetical protein